MADDGPPPCHACAQLAALTPRQRECLQAAAAHLSSKEIARSLGISQHTVDGHLAAAISALGALNRRDAVIRFETLQKAHSEEITGQSSSVPNPPEPNIPGAPADMVREPQASPFVAPELDRPVRIDRKDDIVSALKIVALILALAVLMILVTVGVEPMVNSANKLADFVRSLRHASLW